MTKYFTLALASFSSGCTPDAQYDLVHETDARPIGTSIQIEAAPPSPVWFSPHPVRVYLIHNDARRLVVEDRLANDGARLGPDNFMVTFDAGSALICFRGQEQTDVLHTIPLGGAPAHRDEGGC
jgi:hypothetical protein